MSVSGRRFRFHTAGLPAATLSLALLTLGLSASLRADDGDGDPTFGSAGLAVPGTGWGRAVIARDDGSLRVGVTKGTDIGVVAIRADGTVHTPFGVSGWRVVAPYPGGPNSDDLRALLERSNGKLLLVAQSEDGPDSRPVLVQLNSSGSIDTGFGTDGVRPVYFSSFAVRVYDAALQADGKVVLVGGCSDCLPPTTLDSFVARFNVDGSVDSSFGTNGWTVFDGDEIGHGYNYARVVTIDTAGKIVVGGTAGFSEDERPYVARLRTNGTLDPTFASNGLQTLLELPLQSVTALAVDPERKTILVATTEAEPSYPSPGFQTAIARLTDTGAVDSGWSGDGYFALNIEEGTTVTQLLVQSNGRVVAVGAMNASGDQWSGFFLARFLSTGALDTTFDGNGLKRVEFDLDANAHDVASAATLSGGRIVAVGAAADGASYQVALYRSESALIFRGAFEAGSTSGWSVAQAGS